MKGTFLVIPILFFKESNTKGSENAFKLAVSFSHCEITRNLLVFLYFKNNSRSPFYGIGTSCYLFIILNIYDAIKKKNVSLTQAIV